MKFRLRVPRPEHKESDIRRTCRNEKKNLRRFVLKIKKDNPSCDVEVWSMDEHRLGLKPVLRREWVDEFSNATVLGARTASEGGDVSPKLGGKSNLTQSPLKSEAHAVPKVGAG
jgi:hypothetical protein